jgi:hypothetical protein
VKVLLARLSEYVWLLDNCFHQHMVDVSAISRHEVTCNCCCLLLAAMCRDEVCRAVGNRHFTFSLLVHSDASSPMVDWSQNSSILQVR